MMPGRYSLQQILCLFAGLQTGKLVSAGKAKGFMVGGPSKEPV
jgi:hypothetical protein